MFNITKQQFDGIGINYNCLQKQKKTTQKKFMTNVELQQTEVSISTLFCWFCTVLLWWKMFLTIILKYILHCNEKYS